VAELAKEYNFHNVGGTSAGAIAAVVTAAAAYGRRQMERGLTPAPAEDPFTGRVDALPKELTASPDPSSRRYAGKTRLESLFQPASETAWAFDTLMGCLGRRGMVRKLAAVAWTAIRAFPLAALIGLALGLVLMAPSIVLLRASGIAALPLAGLVLSALVAVILALALPIVLGTRRTLKALPRNRFGLCSGVNDGGTVPALTNWMHELIQSVAGRALDDDPVTFGDLWDNGADAHQPRDIDLILMTTNVTLGISHQIPFMDDTWGMIYFRKSDFDALFPARVVAHLIAHQGAASGRHDVPDGFHALPQAADLPLLFGARMSLSFPVLLSAVPLFLPDPATADDGNGHMKLRRCWYSDGGLVSNFPVHLFDAPLPSRPTFGINLMPVHKQAVFDVTGDGADEFPDLPAHEPPRPDDWDYVYMPTTNSGRSGGLRFNDRFEGNGGSIFGFLVALVDTARNWADTELTAMPGYRDRIVHVSLEPDEGGLNLNMPEPIIDRVAARGALAGQLLRERFARGRDPQPRNEGKTLELTWENHRWVRFRSMMAALETLGWSFNRAWFRTDPDAPGSYRALMDRKRTAKDGSYRWGTRQQADYADKVMRALNVFAEFWSDPATLGDDTFDRGDTSANGRSPRPKPALRVMPPGSDDPYRERPWRGRQGGGGPDNTV
ncbi:MAG: hypothetical protein ACR2PM_10950, partial [Hyphomicrobiales bacterium]